MALMMGKLHAALRAAERKVEDLRQQQERLDYQRHTEEFNRQMNAGGATTPSFVPYDRSLMPGLTPQGFSRN